MAKRGTKRQRRRAPLALVFLLGLALGLGIVFAGYRVQRSYLLVESKDLVELVQRFNQLAIECRRPGQGL